MLELKFIIEPFIGSPVETSVTSIVIEALETGEKQILAELDESNLALAAALSQGENLEQELSDTKQSLNKKLVIALGEKSEIEKSDFEIMLEDIKNMKDDMEIMKEEMEIMKEKSDINSDASEMKNEIIELIDEKLNTLTSNMDNQMEEMNTTIDTIKDTLMEEISNSLEEQIKTIVKKQINRLAMLPFLVVAVEWLRSFGPLGFPWGNLALTQTKILPLLQ